MACPLGIRLPKRQSKHRCQAEPRESGQQHKNEKLFFKNLIFQKISIEVVIITFSEFLMLVYGLGYFFFFFLDEDYILGGGFACRVCDRLRASKLSKDPLLCRVGMGGPKAAWTWSNTAGTQEAAWGAGHGDTQVTELGFCNLFPTVCAYESSTSTLPHNPPVT